MKNALDRFPILPAGMERFDILLSTFKIFSYCRSQDILEDTSRVMRYNLEEEVQNYTSLVLQKFSGTVYDNIDEQ